VRVHACACVCVVFMVQTDPAKHLYSKEWMVEYMPK